MNDFEVKTFYLKYFILIKKINRINKYKNKFHKNIKIK